MSVLLDAMPWLLLGAGIAALALIFIIGNRADSALEKDDEA